MTLTFDSGPLITSSTGLVQSGGIVEVSFITFAIPFLVREPLTNSESFSCAEKMRQFKAPIAGNSKAIAKMGNAELDGPALRHFNK